MPSCVQSDDPVPFFLQLPVGVAHHPDRPLDPVDNKLFPFRILFGGVGLIPPATALNYIPWAMVGFVFQYMVRRRRFSFWAKYNCTFVPCDIPRVANADPWACEDVLSAALDAGTAISVVLIFFW